MTGAQAALPPVDPGVQVSASIERHPGPLFTERPAQVIRVAPGDTLEKLATTFRVSAATLRWANAIHDVQEPVAGTRLIVPPSDGALVRVARSEAPSRIAAEVGVDPRVILDYNALSDDSPLAAGSWVQVPRAVAPAGALDNTVVVPSAPFQPMIPSTQHSNGHDNAFPYGQCTYYVASRRHVTWAGNGGAWYTAARAAGRPVGRIPVVGAAAVMWGSWYGHVAYVEKVNPDGSFVVSEMNVVGLGVVDQRTLTMTPMVIGFVY